MFDNATFDPASLPPSFLWGTATASYQIEGATRADGRGTSIWDAFCATPGKVKAADTGDIACDHYHRYREDIALMQRMGVGAYRLSLAWPRILPDGTGTVNQKGLDFYSRLVETVLEAGLRPFVTLYHWDLPQSLQERWGGWVGRDTADAYVEYVNVVTRALGDRVKDWITLNEPWCSAFLGYVLGIHAPGIQRLPDGLRAGHHLLLAHGRAVPVIRANSSAARVGITLNFTPSHPATDHPADVQTAEMRHAFANLWFMDPLYKGRYPDAIQEAAEASGGLPIAQHDMQAIAAPLDFLGVNYYTRSVVQADPTGRNLGGNEVRQEGREYTAMDWEVYPQGLYDLLTWIQRDYAPPTLYITENGTAFADVVADDGHVHDARRTAYLHSHFAAAAQAARDGVPLRGYFVWSFMDNFEWAEGYSKRFGLVYVDYATQTRIVKDSGLWLSRLLGGSL